MGKEFPQINSDLIRGNVDTIVLKCLQIGDMYGLEICDLVKRASNGTFILKQPTLYSSLKRLEKQKLVSGYWKDSAVGGRRHYYKLTDTGLSKFGTKKGDWGDAKDVIDTLIGGLRQQREEILEEQANDAAVIAERIAERSTEEVAISPAIPSIDSMMAANEAMPKSLVNTAPDEPVEFKGSRSLIAEILREYDNSRGEYVGASFAAVPNYDPLAESESVTTIPLVKQDTSPVVETLKPFVFNADFGEERPVEGPRKDEIVQLELVVDSDEETSHGSKEGVVEDSNKPREVQKTTFKPKTASDRLNSDGELLESEYETVPKFAKYLSPDDYARATTAPHSGTHVGGKLMVKENIPIRPFRKQGIHRFGSGYIFVNRIRFAGAVLAAVAICLALLGIKSATHPSTEGERAFFTISFMIIACYVAVHAVLFATYPKITRKSEFRWENIVVRLGLFIAFTIIILGVNALGGLNESNMDEHVVYWSVPCIMASIILIEGFLRLLLVKTKLFAT